MVAINYNFQIEKGSDFEISFIYTDETGSPVDLSDRCVVLSIVPEESSTIEPFSYTNEPSEQTNTNKGFVTTNASGIITIKLFAIETNTFNFNNAFYDLDVRGLDNFSNTRISTGSIEIVQRNSILETTPVPGQDNILKFKDCDEISTGNSGGDGEDGEDGGTPTPTPPPNNLQIEDLCYPYGYCSSSLFTKPYSGSTLIIPDISSVTGSINIADTGIITNVELTIGNLNHSSPTDLVFILSPPSGDDILLSANHKILNYAPNFNFTFSNNAPPNKYLHNINTAQLCNIYNKTSLIKYDAPLLYSFDHLFGHSLPGQWDLIIQDTDPSGTGSIASWVLNITYAPDNNLEIEEE